MKSAFVATLVLAGLCGCVSSLENSNEGDPVLNTEDSVASAPRGYRIVQNFDSVPTSDGRGYVDSSPMPLPVPRGLGWREEYQNLPAQILRDTLILHLNYSGGCVEDHRFSLYFSKEPGSVSKVLAYLHHDGGNDLCYALIYRWIRFGIDSLKKDFKVTGKIQIEARPEIMSGTGGLYTPFSIEY